MKFNKIKNMLKLAKKQFPRDCPHCGETVTGIKDMVKHINKCRSTQEDIKQTKKKFKLK